MPTLFDVATVAGCSITTVSHVLNGTRPVARDTRRAVEAAVHEVGYHHKGRLSRAPRDLVTVGLTVSGRSHCELVAAIEQELTRAGRLLMTIDTHDDPDTERRAVASLLAHRVEALLITPTVGWAEHTWPILADLRVPFVLIDRVVSAHTPVPIAVDQLAVQSEPAAYALVEHLLQLEHRRIAIISGAPGLSTTTERLRGYHSAHRYRQVPVDQSLVRHAPLGVESGRRAMLQLLRHPCPPTAVFSAGGAATTIGVLIALRERHIAIPDDVAVVAFDELDWSDLIQPGLTTAAQPNHALGAHAVRTLLDKLTNPDQSPRTIRIPAYIEHRGSCGCTDTSSLRRDEVKTTA